MTILQAAGFSVCCACMIVLLKQQAPVIGLVLLMAGSCILCLNLLQSLEPVMAWMTRINEIIGGAGFSVLIKAIGIALTAQLAQDICKDAGAQTLSGVVELVGRVMIIAAALPEAQAVLELAERMLR